jgi:FtsH-binding integral membrane protein
MSIAPLVLMTYGWYLGQLHQSGYDIAGILLFFTGAVGLVLAFIIHRFTRKFSWHNKWFANILTGVASCGVVFALVLLYAWLHG